MFKHGIKTAEVLEFTVDPAIIVHIIYNQGGNEAKAILELVMNSIDAGATSIRIDFNEHGFTCIDNGKGFASREEIEKHFQRFGTPHIVGDARFGRYRLGRGQIMAFAKTKWLTQNWEMVVDIPSTGLVFSLRPVKDNFPGCHITGEWYAHKEEWERREILRELKKQLRYLDMTIEINGVKVGKEQFRERWDHEDDLAYYRIEERSGAMDIFNMGIFVKHEPSRLWGAGGVILSKKAIALNTSRTEVMQELCPVWSSISEKMESLIEQDERTRRKNIWTVERKERALSKILDIHPDTLELFRDAPIISLVGHSKSISIGTFLFGRKFLLGTNQTDYKFKKLAICESRADLPDAETVAAMYPDIAVIHPSTFLEVFGSHSSYDFMSILMDAQLAAFSKSSSIGDLCHENSYALRMRGSYDVKQREIELADFRTLCRTIDRRTRILNPSQCLKGEELRVWGAFKLPIKKFAERVRILMDPLNDQGVEIMIGTSQSAEAWTDGGSCVFLSVDLVKKLCSNPVQHAQRLFQIVEHEMVHSHGGGDQTLSAEHDFNFYKRFHDITLAAAPLRQTMIRKGLKAYRYTLNMRRGKIADDGWYRRTCRYRVKPKSCDREVALFLDILVLRMSLIGDYDLPLGKDALKVDEDIISIIEQRFRSETSATPPPKSADEVLTEALYLAGVHSGKNAKEHEDPDWGYTAEALRSAFDKLLENACFTWLAHQALADMKIMELCKSAVWHGRSLYLSDLHDQYGEKLTAEQLVDNFKSWLNRKCTVDKMAPAQSPDQWCIDRNKYEEDIGESLKNLRRKFGEAPPPLSAIIPEARNMLFRVDIADSMLRYLARLASKNANDRNLN